MTSKQAEHKPAAKYRLKFVPDTYIRAIPDAADLIGPQ
jgi:hypothetical protein